MNKYLALRLAAAMLALPLASQAAGVSPRTLPAGGAGATFGSLQVRLWYEGTGTLSQNIAPPTSFSAWNIIIGGGGAAEVANDALFTAEVLSNGREAHVDTPLTLTERGPNGKVLASRRITSTLTSKEGRAVKGLWVSDIGCAGKLTFEAKFGGAHRSLKVDFPCGE